MTNDVRGAEHEGDAPDLARDVSRIVGSGHAHASYGADERLREIYGATHLISIGVINSNLGERDRGEIDRTFATIADAAAGWLRRRDVLIPGTLVSIHLVRETDLRLVSWSRSTGGCRFWIDADGRPTTMPPASSSPDEL